ncbi:MAG TPA: hypothetical protein VFF27_13720, partial [Bacteroidia bacterium]|nr:hypothetical protein [Bacteroidia bacterium]
ELIVKAISTTKDTLSIPPKLWLFGVMDDGKSSYVLPDQYDGDAYFDGYRKDDTDTTRNISTYHFTITRYLQQVISGRLGNNGLHLCVQDGNTSFYRILVGGGTPTLTGGGENKYQMKLNVTYTKLN